MIYLASPYSHEDPKVKVERFQQAVKAVGKLVKKGIYVFSPVVHSHPVAWHCKLPGDWEYWGVVDRKMLVCCDELWVLALPGWSKSRGVKEEIGWAREMGKEITVVTPEVL